MGKCWWLLFFGTFRIVKSPKTRNTKSDFKNREGNTNLIVINRFKLFLFSSTCRRIPYSND